MEKNIQLPKQLLSQYFDASAHMLLKQMTLSWKKKYVNSPNVER